MAKNDRDDPVLSFTPPARSNKAGGKFMGFMVIVLGAALAVGGFVLQGQSEPVRNEGVSAVGILQSFKHVEAQGDVLSGYVAQVEFYPEGGNMHVAEARVPVAAQNPNVLQSAYTVYYMPNNPERTFIQGIDATMSPLPFLGAGVLVALFGLFLMFKPRGQ